MDDSGSRDKIFVLEAGLLYRKVNGKLLCVIPRAMHKGLVVAAHDLKGHPSVDRTIANILQDFWFVRMRRYMKFHIKMCIECLLDSQVYYIRLLLARGLLTLCT